MRERVQRLATEFGSTLVLPCDVASDEEIATLFAQLGQSWDNLGGIVHVIASAPRDALPGPIKTLAAVGVGDFSKLLGHVEKNSPLKRNVTTEVAGNAAAFLRSDLAGGIIHLSFVVISGAFFFARGIWMLPAPPGPRHAG